MYRRAIQIVDDGDQRTITMTARGYGVLRDPALNKGSAFDDRERDELGLHGLLPPAVTDELEPQLQRVYDQYSALDRDLDKHIYMWRLDDNNVVLFYGLLQRHLIEMLPVVYDPTLGEAIEKFSTVFTRPRGVFLSINRIDEVEADLAAFGATADEIDLIVATDAEEIRGIGDWGFDIAIGKLAACTAAAGVDPHRVIPVMLDDGTNNIGLLDDPLYIGNRHSRVRGQAYDDFIDAYVQAATKLVPNALLHREDFGSTNARRILERSRDEA
jgi:malate dehydrogenase (oxaloacetate-decarboxylating)